MALRAIRLAALAVIPALAAGAAGAAPQRCPPHLAVRQAAPDLPAGMTAYDTMDDHPWIGVEFSDGPPAEHAWLAPDRAGKAVASWEFAPAGPGGIWLACGYAGTSVVAAYRLPDTVRSCRVEYDAQFDPPAAKSVDCR